MWREGRKLKNKKNNTGTFFSFFFLWQTRSKKKKKWVGVLSCFYLFLPLKPVLPAILLVLSCYYLGDGCDMLIIYGSEKIDFPEQKCFQFSQGHNFMSTTK